VPKDVLYNITSYYDKVTRSNPDTFSDSYKQWFVQYSVPNNQIRDYEWIHWRDDDQLAITKKFFSQFVKDLLRFRFSLLHKNHEVKYHTKHDLPRIHIPLNDSKSEFVIRDKNGVEYFYPLEYGNAYFVNVTLDHRVISTKPIDRKNCFFCFTEFDDSVVDRFKRCDQKEAL
jgi:hypothetical protein